MAKRPCAEPGCPALLDTAGRCDEHRRAKDRERGSSTARGYGAAHRALRAAWQRRLDAGETVWCWRCITHRVRTRIDPTDWHLGHDDHDRARYRGPECPPCNLASRSASRSAPAVT